MPGNLGVSQGGGPPRCRGGNIEAGCRIKVFVPGERPRDHFVFTPDWEYGPNRDRRGVTDGTGDLVTSHVRVKISPRFRHELGSCWEFRPSTPDVGHPNCAGVDIGSLRRGERVSERPFGAQDVEDMRRGWNRREVDVVAMEASPVYEVLDRAGFEVHLVDATQVSGRKSDVRLSGIRELMSYGLLRGAFRPRDEDCVLRSLRAPTRSLGSRASAVRTAHAKSTDADERATRHGVE